MSIDLAMTVMVIQPAQLPGRQSRRLTGALLLLQFRMQYRDSPGNVSLYLFLNAAEQHRNGNVEDRRERERGPKRREPPALFISAYFCSVLRAQQKGYVLLAEA